MYKKKILFKTDDEQKILISKCQKNKYLKIKKLCKKMNIKNYIKSNGDVVITDQDNVIISGNVFRVFYFLHNRYRQQRQVLKNGK